MKNNIGGFINCICTYLSIIYKNLVGDDTYLMFLADKVILWQDKIVKEDISDLNPWNSQPYIIGNKQYLFKGMTEQYMEYLQKKIHLKFEWGKISCLKKHIKEKMNIIIVPVDEYYIGHSKFYKLKHNRHFLMLFGYSNGKSKYVDSECVGSGEIEFDEVVRAMEATGDNENLLIVDCSDFKQDKRQRERVLETKLSIPKIKEDIITENINFSHYLEALRLSIVFQIRPYVLLHKNYSTSCSKIINEIYLSLENLATYLLVGNIRQKIEHTKVLNLIENFNFKIEKMDWEEF